MIAEDVILKWMGTGPSVELARNSKMLKTTNQI